MKNLEEVEKDLKQQRMLLEMEEKSLIWYLKQNLDLIESISKYFQKESAFLILADAELPKLQRVFFRLLQEKDDVPPSYQRRLEQMEASCQLYQKLNQKEEKEKAKDVFDDSIGVPKKVRNLISYKDRIIYLDDTMTFLLKLIKENPANYKTLVYQKFGSNFHYLYLINYILSYYPECMDQKMLDLFLQTTDFYQGTKPEDITFQIYPSLLKLTNKNLKVVKGNMEKEKIKEKIYSLLPNRKNIACSKK